MCRGLDYLLSNIDEYGMRKEFQAVDNRTMYARLATWSQSGYY